MFAHAAYNTNIFGEPTGSPIFYHILFNMFMLWMFGRILENVWGPKRFTIFYLICGSSCSGTPDHAIHNGWQRTGCWRFRRYFRVLVCLLELLFPIQSYIMFIPILFKAKWAILGLVARFIWWYFSDFRAIILRICSFWAAPFYRFYFWENLEQTNRRTLYIYIESSAACMFCLRFQAAG